MHVFYNLGNVGFAVIYQLFGVKLINLQSHLCTVFDIQNVWLTFYYDILHDLSASYRITSLPYIKLVQNYFYLFSGNTTLFLFTILFQMFLYYICSLPHTTLVLYQLFTSYYITNLLPTTLLSTVIAVTLQAAVLAHWGISSPHASGIPGICVRARTRLWQYRMNIIVKCAHDSAVRT